MPRVRRSDPVFRWLVSTAGLGETEAYRVFNMGLGMMAIVDAGDVRAALRALEAAGQEAWVAGHLEPGKGVRFGKRRQFT